MVAVCPQCSRANTSDARYCYFDGSALSGTASVPPDALASTFATPFVFSTGVRCKTFDDFAKGCLEHWDEAVDLLQQGTLLAFFSGLGRMDLVQAAQETAAFPDRNRGLDLFLGRLPLKDLPAAKLDVRPKGFNLGTLKVGQDSQVELHLENKGRRLIFGSISSDCKWLAVTDTGEAKLVQFRQSSSVIIPIKGQHLRAANKPIEGTLLVETNAGTLQLKVIAEVPIQPYPDGILAGAHSPRILAEKAKEFPKQAAPLFENGAVAKWYRANGWTYPVQGPAANGLAAVQQFFEALGVAKPPKVKVADLRVVLRGKPGSKLVHQIEISSEENRPVYAHAVCSESWLAVKPALLRGRTATLPIEITVPTSVEASVQTVVKVQANGQQRFDVAVQLIVEDVRAASPIMAAGAAAVTKGQSEANAIATIPLRKAKAVSNLPTETDLRPPLSKEMSPQPALPLNALKLLIHGIPLVVLGLLLLVLIGKDALSSNPKPKQVIIKDGPLEEELVAKTQVAPPATIQDEPDEQLNVIPVARFKIEDEPQEQLNNKLPLSPVKVEIKDEPAELAPGKADGKGVPIDPTPRIQYQYGFTKSWGLTDTITGKRLTFSANGSTNRTVIRVGGKSQGIGVNGDFRELPDDPLGEACKRSSYAYVTPPGLRVTQILEIVPSKQPVDVGGKQRRLLDTLLVRYLLENTSQKPINAGVRLEVDTLIGNNDGVPFTVPGKGLVNTSANFIRPEDVPDFVQALETGNLQNPGTIVHISLKVGGGMEAPSQVTLCHWASNGDLSNIRPTAMGSDSAIIMVWPDKNLPPGQRREMGYAYGLGSVTASEGGTMAVTLGGNYDIGQSFTITAYVNKPAQGQTLTLDLPAGLDRIKGEQTQRVTAATVGTTSIVSWEAKVLQTGVFPVKVRSSTGITQTKTITIARSAAPTGGKLNIDLDGSFEPGQMFNVIGKVNEPLDNQTLTLDLPNGLQRVEGEATQRVPAPPVGSTDSVVRWKVRVVAAGKYPVRVSSSTGARQTKTITIEQTNRGEGLFQIALTGDFAPGKIFTVSTRVVNPVPDQKLTLELPDGLQLVAGDQVQTAQADTPLSWKVRIKEVGKFMVRVKSTTGITQRKTIIIEPPGDQGGRFSFELNGDIRVGKAFRVVAEVTNPAQGQTLTLLLPKGLQLQSDETAQKTVAMPAGLNGTSTVVWTVRVTASGRLPVRIESSTGYTRTKTITLSETNKSLFGQ